MFYGTSQTVSICVTINIDKEFFPSKIKLSKPKSISNSFFRVKEDNSESFTRFAEKTKNLKRKLDEMIFIYQTHPVASILQREPYYNEAQIRKLIRKGHSHEVLRNKILKGRDHKDPLQDQLSSILEKNIILSFPPKTHREKEEYINIFVEYGKKKLEIYLQGSGFLQVAEIVSTLDFIDAPLKLLLVDEPDSHIHSKLQTNLIKHLRSVRGNQFFIITHNDHFVDNASDGEVFFLDDKAKNDGKLIPMQQKHFDTIKKALGGVTMNLAKLNHSNILKSV